MKSLIVTFLTCVFAYLLYILCTGGFKVDSDTYGYYKNGKLNERGIISIVDRVKRMIPLKTPDTTVVGINYNYEDANIPHGQINYYHVVDKDKLDYYKKNSQDIVNRMATAQCSNKDIVDMLEQLDKITISFYDEETFLYGLEISAETCTGSNSKVNHDEPKSKKEEKQTKKDNETESKAKDLSNSQNVSTKNIAVQTHVVAMNKILPFKINFGELAAVEVEDENSIRHHYKINKESIGLFRKNMKNISSKVVQSYCKNTELSGLMKKIDHISLSFEYEKETLLVVQVSKNTCL